MKVQITGNKYINALLLLMIFSAAIHMLILIFIAIKTSNLYFLNYFNILSISYFIPNFSNSFWGNIISFVFAAVLYFIILKINKLKSEQ
ncbi:MAG: hypothetical protein A2998_02405 [Candidatus Staskawiczbacteria bacterium RIFCSPLOWO2_01_FULL_37_25b]|uniref:Uncharacterized protein n=2 Tax=Candidatus Staskawicziibacteriota TaxID=1817916 RepID=A0A1G2HP63_9BACT|nr:MAG: hypothetical protein A2812_00715 [Candidatus Staskawiczbacteria bacterium RIFCSPHIGHO2_01_FULL_36_16]OGZ74172.1 MAG: hypothetical protein A2998_02405 [Candidatus Staskawiczbacteria bacterium RIFCSPLOWO2_01_FULL_37_25b]